MLVKLVRTLWDPLFASVILCCRRRMAATQGRQEVTMGDIKCPRCKDTFLPEYDGVRFRAGSFYDPERDEQYSQICEDCHRELTDK